MDKVPVIRALPTKFPTLISGTANFSDSPPNVYLNKTSSQNHVSKRTVQSFCDKTFMVRSPNKHKQSSCSHDQKPSRSLRSHFGHLTMGTSLMFAQHFNGYGHSLTIDGSRRACDVASPHYGTQVCTPSARENPVNWGGDDEK